MLRTSAEVKLHGQCYFDRPNASKKKLLLKNHWQNASKKATTWDVAEVQREHWESPWAAHICFTLDIKNNADCSCLHLWEGEVALIGQNYKQKCVMCHSFEWFMSVWKKTDIYCHFTLLNKKGEHAERMYSVALVWATSMKKSKG